MYQQKLYIIICTTENDSPCTEEPFALRNALDTLLSITLYDLVNSCPLLRGSKRSF